MARGSFLSENDRRVLELFPADVPADDLARCFALSVRDLDLAWARSDEAGRLAAGLQIGAMRLLGFVPDDVDSAPDAVIEFVAGQVEAVVKDLSEYSERRQTRWEHATSVERHLGFRRCGTAELKELDGWLEEQALEHDRPVTLLAMACDHLMAERAGGCQIDLDDAYMAEMMSFLPSVGTEIAGSETLARERFSQLAADRVPEPDAPLLIGGTRSRLALRSVANLDERIELRLGEEPNGDRAGLVTPGDLYRLGPLSTVARWDRDRTGVWADTL